jgi:hypothetical protein
VNCSRMALRRLFSASLWLVFFWWAVSRGLLVDPPPEEVLGLMVLRAVGVAEADGDADWEHDWAGEGAWEGALVFAMSEA